MYGKDGEREGKVGWAAGQEQKQGYFGVAGCEGHRTDRGYRKAGSREAALGPFAQGFGFAERQQGGNGGLGQSLNQNGGFVMSSGQNLEFGLSQGQNVNLGGGDLGRGQSSSQNQQRLVKYGVPPNGTGSYVSSLQSQSLNFGGDLSSSQYREQTLNFSNAGDFGREASSSQNRKQPVTCGMSPSQNGKKNVNFGMSTTRNGNYVASSQSYDARSPGQQNVNYGSSSQSQNVNYGLSNMNYGPPSQHQNINYGLSQSQNVNYGSSSQNYANANHGSSLLNQNVNYGSSSQHYANTNHGSSLLSQNVNYRMPQSGNMAQTSSSSQNQHVSYGPLSLQQNANYRSSTQKHGTILHKHTDCGALSQQQFVHAHQQNVNFVQEYVIPQNQNTSLRRSQQYVASHGPCASSQNTNFQSVQNPSVNKNPDANNANVNYQTCTQQEINGQRKKGTQREQRKATKRTEDPPKVPKKKKETTTQQRQGHFATQPVSTVATEPRKESHQGNETDKDQKQENWDPEVTETIDGSNTIYTVNVPNQMTPPETSFTRHPPSLTSSVASFSRTTSSSSSTKSSRRTRNIKSPELNMLASKQARGKRNRMRTMESGQAVTSSKQTSQSIRRRSSGRKTPRKPAKQSIRKKPIKTKQIEESDSPPAETSRNVSVAQELLKMLEMKMKPPESMDGTQSNNRDDEDEDEEEVEEKEQEKDLKSLLPENIPRRLRNLVVDEAKMDKVMEEEDGIIDLLEFVKDENRYNEYVMFQTRVQTESGNDYINFTSGDENEEENDKHKDIENGGTGDLYDLARAAYQYVDAKTLNITGFRIGQRKWVFRFDQNVFELGHVKDVRRYHDLIAYEDGVEEWVLRDLVSEEQIETVDEVKHFTTEDVPDHVMENMFQLTKANMQPMYDAADGWDNWDDVQKRKELTETDDMMFWVVFGKVEEDDLVCRDVLDNIIAGISNEPNDSPVETRKMLGFVAFRFLYESNFPLLYISELQLIPEARGHGLGKFLMWELELLAKRFEAKYLMLTVLKINENAFNFYENRRFGVDEQCPSHTSQNEKLPYRLMTKVLDRDIYKFSCNQCPNGSVGFRYYDSLLIHGCLEHGEPWPYPCKVDGCDLGVVDRAHLNGHFSLHGNVVPRCTSQRLAARNAPSYTEKVDSVDGPDVSGSSSIRSKPQGGKQSSPMKSFLLKNEMIRMRALLSAIGPKRKLGRPSGGCISSPLHHHHQQQKKRKSLATVVNNDTTGRHKSTSPSSSSRSRNRRNDKNRKRKSAKNISRGKSRVEVKASSGDDEEENDEDQEEFVGDTSDGEDEGKRSERKCRNSEQIVSRKAHSSGKDSRRRRKTPQSHLTSEESASTKGKEETTSSTMEPKVEDVLTEKVYAEFTLDRSVTSRALRHLKREEVKVFQFVCDGDSAEAQTDTSKQQEKGNSTLETESATKNAMGEEQRSAASTIDGEEEQAKNEGEAGTKVIRQRSRSKKSRKPNEPTSMPANDVPGEGVAPTRRSTRQNISETVETTNKEQDFEEIPERFTRPRTRQSLGEKQDVQRADESVDKDETQMPPKKKAQEVKTNDEICSRSLRRTKQSVGNRIPDRDTTRTKATVETRSGRKTRQCVGKEAHEEDAKLLLEASTRSGRKTRQNVGKEDHEEDAKLLLEARTRSGRQTRQSLGKEAHEEDGKLLLEASTTSGRKTKQNVGKKNFDNDIAATNDDAETTTRQTRQRLRRRDDKEHVDLPNNKRITRRSSQKSDQKKEKEDIINVVHVVADDGEEEDSRPPKRIPRRTSQRHDALENQEGKVTEQVDEEPRQTPRRRQTRQSVGKDGSKKCSTTKNKQQEPLTKVASDKEDIEEETGTREVAESTSEIEGKSERKASPSDKASNEEDPQLSRTRRQSAKLDNEKKKQESSRKPRTRPSRDRKKVFAIGERRSVRLRQSKVIYLDHDDDELAAEPGAASKGEELGRTENGNEDEHVMMKQQLKDKREPDTSSQVAPKDENQEEALEQEGGKFPTRATRRKRPREKRKEKSPKKRSRVLVNPNSVDVKASTQAEAMNTTTINDDTSLKEANDVDGRNDGTTKEEVVEKEREIGRASEADTSTSVNETSERKVDQRRKEKRTEIAPQQGGQDHDENVDVGPERTENEFVAHNKVEIKELKFGSLNEDVEVPKVKRHAGNPLSMTDSLEKLPVMVQQPPTEPCMAPSPEVGDQENLDVESIEDDSSSVGPNLWTIDNKRIYKKTTKKQQVARDVESDQEEEEDEGEIQEDYESLNQEEEKHGEDDRAVVNIDQVLIVDYVDTSKEESLEQHNKSLEERENKDVLGNQDKSISSPLKEVRAKKRNQRLLSPSFEETDGEDVAKVSSVWERRVRSKEVEEDEHVPNVTSAWQRRVGTGRDEMEYQLLDEDVEKPKVSSAWQRRVKSKEGIHHENLGNEVNNDADGDDEEDGLDNTFLGARLVDANGKRIVRHRKDVSDYHDIEI